jgi:hypothetical protein
MSDKPTLETEASATPPAESAGGITNTNIGRRNLRTPWVKGQSGNPKGRPRIEPRVRRYARTYDQRMCKVLASIAEDPKAPWSERRRAAMDLIAVGSGRPSVTQEVLRPETGAPLVHIDMRGGPSSAGMTPAQAREFIRGNPRAPREQLEAAETVLIDAAATATALPRPSEATALPCEALDQASGNAETDRSNVIRLDSRNELEPGK